eukprot:3135942-Pleurochrysis_carterae.AAC.1
MNKAFQSWKTRVRHECHEQVEGQENGDGRLKREREDDDFSAGKTKTPEMGASGPLRLTSSQEELIPYHTIVLLRGESIHHNKALL